MFIEPKKGLSLKECKFYHSVPLSDGSIIPGDWDLTKCADVYLGNMNYANKRVIDVGAGSGFLSFFMEQEGASVVSYDMPDGSYWDVLKYPGYFATAPNSTSIIAKVSSIGFFVVSA